MAFFGFGGRTPSGSDGKTLRPAAVAGSFYPADKDGLRAQLDECYATGRRLGGSEAGRPLALIVPHAGYVYSGGVAAAGFLSVAEDAVYERVILIGPSHRVAFAGAAVDTGNDAYLTPLGEVPVDVSFGKKLVSSGSPFTYRADAFSAEHDLEVQLPLMQYRFKKMPPIVPIVLGTVRYPILKAVAEALKPWMDGKTLFVISSDFSHYPSYAGAVKADGRTGDAIATGDIAAFAEALRKNGEDGIRGLETSACGQAAIAVLMEMTGGNEAFEYQHIAYKNSGDSPYGDRDAVVGYHAFSVYRKEAAGFSLSAGEKAALLQIARRSIEGYFRGENEAASWKDAELSSKLKARGGVFVTLNKNGFLRGCIGHFGKDTQVYRLVAEMARAAAFEDPRFPQVRSSEMPEIEIEISVLSPLRKISSADEFNYGKEGIYMMKGGRSGTFLPQVAAESGWTKEEFLGHCARDKAGIGWDGWRTADLYTYEAAVFGEK